MEKGAYFLEGPAGAASAATRSSATSTAWAWRCAWRSASRTTASRRPRRIVDRMVDEGLKGDLEVDGKTYGLVLDIGGYYKNVITLAPALTSPTRRSILALLCSISS